MILGRFVIWRSFPDQFKPEQQNLYNQPCPISGKYISSKLMLLLAMGDISGDWNGLGGIRKVEYHVELFTHPIPQKSVQ
jgi:hypothetical protein